MGRKIENCILIVYGGESAEHDISIITALTIYKKYRLKNKQIKLLYQSRDGRWFIGDELTNFKSYKNFNHSKFEEVVFISGSSELYLKKKQRLVPIFKIEFVVNCFHGGAGENGEFVSILSQAKIPSSSSSSIGLGVSMDKYLTKLTAIALDVPIVDFFNFTYLEWVNSRERVMQQLVQFDFPVVVKPVSQGSSIGVCFATTIEEFTKAVNLAFKFDKSIIVERAIVHKREFNCCLVKTVDGKILYGIDEPVSNKVVISFKDKYLSSNSKGKKCGIKSDAVLGMENQERNGGGLSLKEASKLKKMSRTMYENLDMNGVVRFDFIYDTKKDKFYLGEINAIPGSLGYYFFEDVNLLELIYNAGVNYWEKRFADYMLGAPTIF